MNDRIVAQTTIAGVFSFPIGFSFFGRKAGDYPKTVLISTVCLDGAHLEDPLAISEAETGYETMVFLAGYATGGSIYTKHYKTLDEASAGHNHIVEEIQAGKLTLAIPIDYTAWDAESGDQSEHADNVKREHERMSMRPQKGIWE